MSATNLWSRVVLLATGLLLLTSASAEMPRTITANEIAASTPVFEIIPEDPLTAKITFSDKEIHYEKHYYLRDVLFVGFEYWIDENRYVIEKRERYGSNGEKGEILPQIVVVDVRNGKIEDTGLEGKILCFAEGRIATNNTRLLRQEDGKVVRDEVSYLGELGKPLQEFRPGFPYEMELNKDSCQLVPRWKYPKPKQGEPQFVQRFPLKVEHGAIYLWKPKDFPELRLGRDDYNRFAFNRVGSATVPPLQAYWELPSGKRVDIPLNPGEKIFAVSYLPFKKAYSISLDLTHTQPIETWVYPRFARLLYLDGTIERFCMPRVVMDFMRANRNASLGEAFYKKGVTWGIGLSSFSTDPQKRAGVYEVIGGELVKRSLGGFLAPDGCRRFGSEKRFFSERRDYYYIDTCKGE